MQNETFEAELSRYSQEELRLIYDTQKELYSEDELAMIAKRLEPQPEKKKANRGYVFCCILCCIVPVLGMILWLMMRKNSDPMRRRRGGDYLVCSCFITLGLDLLIILILLCSNNPENKSLGKHCLLTSFISVLLFLFMQAGGFTI